MTATILDGKATAAAIKGELAVRVAALRERGITPGLGTVLVGDDPGSHSYVAGKHRDCAEVGITSHRVDLPADASQAQVDEAIEGLNADPTCTGYIVQLPLPKGLDEARALELIDPDKDADGLHPTNLGRLVLGIPAPLPCTPRGIVELLRRYDVPIAGAEVAVVGRGVTVGRPLGLLLTRKSENATVTLCHTGTRDLGVHTRAADIVVAAAGVAHLITPDLVKPGAAVLDVGITRTDAGLVGDVHPDVREVAGFVAPMPGGVGPMTRAMLLANVVEAAEHLSTEIGRASRRGRGYISVGAVSLKCWRVSSWSAPGTSAGAPSCSRSASRSRCSCGCCSRRPMRGCSRCAPRPSTWSCSRCSPWAPPRSRSGSRRRAPEHRDRRHVPDLGPRAPRGTTCG